MECLIEEHRILVDGHAAGSRRYKRERTHTNELSKWLKEEILKRGYRGYRGYMSRELEVLALGPNRRARRLSGYVINGFRFHTKSRDSRCTTQNSGVFLTAETTSFASSKDQNPITGNVNYFVSIIDIFELDYWVVFTVVLFKCCWYKEEKDYYGLTKVNFSKLCHKSDPYVLAAQVQQVFYVQDPTESMCNYVIKKMPRDWSDSEIHNASEEDIRKAPSHNDEFRCQIETEVADGSWSRDDVPLTQVPIPIN